ncbi:MAG TPA: glycosyl hydrolase [Phycisphaerae bacterium]|nr:glycosyl hydrolase [Phycisphaerae bacterium]HRY69480.1 glycosyl hydrolase [Phycisphaerae bacterium]HSA29106.1 glycosyl hydrolase [Phycisphaerae bacterium]
MSNTRFGSLLLGVIEVLVAAAGCLGEVRSADCERFVIPPDRPARLEWRADPPAHRSDLGYIISDYWAREVAAGEAVADRDGAISISVNLPRGFYEVALPRLGYRGGIVVRPEHAGPEDAFFCMDSALSWLEKREDIRGGLARMLKRIGIVQSRERLRWDAVNKSEDVWDWEGGCQFETLRRTYARHGVKVLEMFHDSPRWLGRTDANPYPTNLLLAARSIGDLGRRWGGTWGGLEIWNEPDVQFGANLPADQYVPLAKAAAWGLREHLPAVPLVGGVLTDIAPDEYRRACAENGLLDQVDAISFHTYQQATTVEDMVSRYRVWLKAYGKESMPLWITESGRPWPKGAPRPAMREDAVSALDIVMKAIESKACGVAAYFAFVYVYYEENQNNFGMMGREVSPLRSMAAYAQMVSALANKAYVGDLKTSDPAVKRARVFSGTGGTVAVLYTGSVNRDAKVRLELAARRLEGIDGRTLSVDAAGGLPVPDGLAYVWLDAGSMADAVVKDTPAVGLYSVSRRPPPSRPAPSSVILRYPFDPSIASFTCKGYHVTHETAACFPLRVVVHNLAEQAGRVDLTPSIKGMASPVAIEPRSLELAPQGWAEVAWEVDVRQGGSDGQPLTIQVAAKGTMVPWISPLAVDLFVEKTVAAHLAGFPVRMALPIARLEAWQENIASQGRMTMSKTKEGGWRLEVHFGAGDRWVYPKLRLGEGVRWGQAKYLLLRARCDKPASVRFIAWEDSQAGYLSRRPLIPADGRWHVVLIPLRDVDSLASSPDGNGRLDADQVHSVSFGMNTEVEDNVLEISDAYLVGEKPG